MPKSPSRTSKKKKYNARFPPARIKKIMQTDEEVGKVAAAVPVIISRALELFIESLVTETSKATMTKNAKTLSTSHIKQTIATNNQFGFLRELVAGVPDHQAEDNNGDAVAPDGEFTGKKGRGRPRKPKEAKEGRRNRGESSKASSNTSEDEDDEEEDDEDTETDEEGSQIAAASSGTSSTSSALHGAMGNSQDRLTQCLPGISHAGSQGFSDGLQSMQPSMPSTVASLQQQFTSSNLPSYHVPLYPPFVPSSSQGATSYPILPQFQNSYPPVVPPSLPHFQPYAHQPPGSQPQPSSDGQQAHIQQPQQQQQQSQPMNLSYLSRLTATTASESDDYDT